MRSNANPRVLKALMLSSLCAALLVSACNDSNASSSSVSKEAPSVPAASSDVAAQHSATALVTQASDIKQRNHVCFTMDVNNVKCVLGDTVAYVPQPILEEEKATSAAKSDNKDAKKGKDSKDKAKDAKAKAEEEQQAQAQAQLIANQNALNEARSLVFVAKYCDMERPVVYSKEGVACTFKPHALYDAGAVAEATQYQINTLRSRDFFKEIQGISGIEKFSGPAFGEFGGYRIFLEKASNRSGMQIGDKTAARILTKRIDSEGNVLGFYHEELNFTNLNPQMKILTAGLVKGDHVKLVFDTSLQNEQPLWRTSSLEFGQPYIWEVSVLEVGPAVENTQQDAAANGSSSNAAKK